MLFDTVTLCTCIKAVLSHRLQYKNVLINRTLNPTKKKRGIKSVSLQLYSFAVACLIMFLQSLLAFLFCSPHL